MEASLETIHALALDAREALPDAFRAPACTVALQVVETAPPDVLAEFEIDDALELTGLYQGIPLTEKSVFDQPQAPDTIWLFRQAILAELADRGTVTLPEMVRHIYVHELAHHFGWSDDDIAEIDRWWE